MYKIHLDKIFVRCSLTLSEIIIDRLKFLRYTPKKFSALPVDRQTILFLETARHLEQNWNDESYRISALKLVREHMALIDWNENHPLRKWSEASSFLPTMNLKHLLNLLVPLERLLGRNYADHDFLVSSKDGATERSLVHPIFVVLENIRSAFNVGSIFRTADCIGAERIFLCGYTSSPDNDGTLKSSLGAEASVKWEQHSDISTVINHFKQKDIICCGLETAAVSTSIYDFKFPKPCALFLGNERFGLQGKTLNQMDHILQIPTFGQKNSLNVGVCFGITSYEVLRQWQ